MPRGHAAARSASNASRRRCTGVALLAVLAFAACDHDAGPVLSDANPAFAASPDNSPAVNRWLAGLRSSIAHYHRIDVAMDAGYDIVFQDACFELPGTGGMGFHYVNGSLVDGLVEEFAPEALMYEPQKNGQMRLVGVEYVVPFAAWSEADPPVLHGQVFSANNTFGLWTLHVWAARNNPTGMFSDWNPTVNCAHAH
jgi:hypothetical protein